MVTPSAPGPGCAGCGTSITPAASIMNAISNFRGFWCEASFPMIPASFYCERVWAIHSGSDWKGSGPRYAASLIYTPLFRNGRSSRPASSAISRRYLGKSGMPSARPAPPTLSPFRDSIWGWSPSFPSFSSVHCYGAFPISSCASRCTSCRF